MINTIKKTGAGFLFALSLLLFGNSCNNQSNMKTNEKLIRDYYSAYEKKDWNMLDSILGPGFVFNSPVDDHIDLKTYKEKCWPNCQNIKKFDIEKLIVDENSGFVTYNGWTNDGRLFRNTEYFKLKDGKILENSCYFGPGVNYPNNTEK